MVFFSVRCSRLCQAHHKKHKTLNTNPPIHIYINRISNRLVFKIKDRCKCELPTLEIMKLSGSIKKVIDQTKTVENMKWLK